MNMIWKKLGTLCLLLCLFFAMSSVCNAEDTNEIIASGRKVLSNGLGDYTWTIDKNGHLTVEGTGNVWEQKIQAYWISPWHDYSDQILSAEINLTGTTDAFYMLNGCMNLKEVDLTNFDTSRLQNIAYMFHDCKSLERIEWGDFDTGKVTNMSWMFYNCSSLETIDLSHFNTENMDFMSGVFAGCVNLKQLDLSNFETSNVITMNEMFSGCERLEELDLSNFDTKNVKIMSNIFSGCWNLKKLDISSFDLGMLGKDETVTLYTYELFPNCDNLRELKLPKNCKLEIQLPLKENCKWKTSNGTAFYYVPLNLTESFTIRRITTPPVVKVFSDV